MAPFLLSKQPISKDHFWLILYNVYLGTQGSVGNTARQKVSRPVNILLGKVLMCDPLPRLLSQTTSIHYPKGCLNVSPL